MVLGPAGRGAAEPAAGAGRAALHARRALRALTQPAPQPPLVSTGELPTVAINYLQSLPDTDIHCLFLT